MRNHMMNVVDVGVQKGVSVLLTPHLVSDNY